MQKGKLLAGTSKLLRALNVVLFPTLGRPTIPIFKVFPGLPKRILLYFSSLIFPVFFSLIFPVFFYFFYLPICSYFDFFFNSLSIAFSFSLGSTYHSQRSTTFPFLLIKNLVQLSLIRSPVNFIKCYHR